MEVQSKRVATAVASVVPSQPFHCEICCEEYTRVDRPPVVLPCGHTYLCAICAKRLDVCHICREPLFVTMPQPESAATDGTPNPGMLWPFQYSPNSYYRRSPGTSGEPSTPPPSQLSLHPQQQQIRLPTPNNVILLAMMENAQQLQKITNSSEQTTLGRMGSQTCQESENKEERSNNENHIIDGMAATLGPCGTYEVRQNEALLILPTDPRLNTKNNVDGKSHLDESSGDSSGETELEQQKSGEISVESIQEIEKGQKVQVVAFEGGVAKLARNSGFIIANSSSQLVKVGEPRDKSCRLEGLLDVVRSGVQKLEEDLEENRRTESILSDQIKGEMMKEPSHPIISEPPTTSEEEALVANVERGDEILNSLSLSISTSSSDEESEQDFDMKQLPYDIEMQQPSNVEFEVDENGELPFTPIPCCAKSNATTYNNSARRSPTTNQYHRAVTTNNQNDLRQQFFSDRGNAANFLDSEQFPSESNPGIPSLRSQSFDCIDFRTGLSGHRALASSSKFRSGPLRRGEARLMSDYKYISSTSK